MRRFKKGDRACIPVTVADVSNAQNYPEYVVRTDKGRSFSVYESELAPQGGEIVRTTGIIGLDGSHIKCMGRVLPDGMEILTEPLPFKEEKIKKCALPINNYSVPFGAGLSGNRLRAVCNSEDFAERCERLAQAYFAAIIILSREC